MNQWASPVQVAGDMGAFTSRAAFDMFSAVMFGRLTETADPATPTDPRHLQFCANVRSPLPSLSRYLFI